MLSFTTFSLYLFKERFSVLCYLTFPPLFQFIVTFDSAELRCKEKLIVKCFPQNDQHCALLFCSLKELLQWQMPVLICPPTSPVLSRVQLGLQRGTSATTPLTSRSFAPLAVHSITDVFVPHVAILWSHRQAITSFKSSPISISPQKWDIRSMGWCQTLRLQAYLQCVPISSCPERQWALSHPFVTRSEEISPQPGDGSVGIFSKGHWYSNFLL